jgi:hypothetical protein
VWYIESSQKLYVGGITDGKEHKTTALKVGKFDVCVQE